MLVDIDEFVDVAEAAMEAVAGVGLPVYVIVFTDGPVGVTEAMVGAVTERRGWLSLDQFCVWYDDITDDLVRQYVDAAEAGRVRQLFGTQPEDVACVVFDVVRGVPVNGRVMDLYSED